MSEGSDLFEYSVSFRMTIVFHLLWCKHVLFIIKGLGASLHMICSQTFFMFALPLVDRNESIKNVTGMPIWGKSLSLMVSVVFCSLVQ